MLDVYTYVAMYILLEKLITAEMIIAAIASVCALQKSHLQKFNQYRYELQYHHLMPHQN